jgi:linoleoyl-CoA desaturase
MQNAQTWSSNEERLQLFAAEIDKLRERLDSEIGAEDAEYVVRLDRFSRIMEAVGRLLIHFSIEPIGFLTGVGALWIHKQIQAIEIGHSALHGVYDKIPGAEKFKADGFYWQIPVDEESWRHAHNVRHHQYTNITGRDPDIRFGLLRWNDRTPFDPKYHPNQLITIVVMTLNIGWMVNFQHSGLANYLMHDLLRPELRDFVKEQTPEALRESLKRFFRKMATYYGREYVFFPMLAGPLFGKVLLGNWMSEKMRDVYTALSLYCGHYGDDIPDYPEGTRAGSKARWYEMQVESTVNYEVPGPVAILCGTLHRQIEHHLFPKCPPNRLRQIAPEVKALCERYGVPYKTASWGKRLGKAFGRLAQLRKPTANDLAAAAAPAVSQTTTSASA